jgi:GTP-binding protein EngB required for normal cell division
MFSQLLSEKATVRIKDEFQQGPNVSQTAAKKIYGWFIGQMQVISPGKSIRTLLSAYQCPTIVMVGSESTGKSSTIENITKVPIFPTAKGICTRCPIKVSLFPEEKEAYSVTFRSKSFQFDAKTKGSLKTCIANIFDQISLSSSLGYTNDEIAVTIERKDVMRMDIVDLPGIVAYPQEAKRFTSDLSLKYIRNKNNFLLCVANATIPRLTSYESIARIIESGACERSVVVLTMADKLEPVDYESFLIERILGKSDELRAHKFSACCTVINRSNTTSCTLEQNTAAEKSWFDTNILKLLRDHGGKQQKDYADKIEANAGINNLLVQVNKKFEEYIKTLWVPQTIKEIDKSVQDLKQSLASLGAPITLYNQDDFQEKFVQLVNIIVQQIFCDDNVLKLFSFSVFPLHGVNSREPLRANLVTVESIIAKITSWVANYDVSTLFSDRLRKKFSVGPYCFQRFPELYEDVKRTLIAQINEVLVPILRRLDSVILSNHFVDPRANKDLFTKMFNAEFIEPWKQGKFCPKLHSELQDKDAGERTRILNQVTKFDEVKLKLIVVAEENIGVNQGHLFATSTSSAAKRLRLH